MSQDETYTQRLREVHIAAAEWYSHSQISTREDLAEALYHRLITAQPEEINSLVERVEPDLLADVAQSSDDFEDEVRVRILHQLGRKISIADAKHLPYDERLRWADTAAAQSVRSGDPKQALAIWRQVNTGSSTSSEWYPTALFQAGDWAAISDLRRVESFEGSLRYPYLMSFVAEGFDPRGSNLLRSHLHALLRKKHGMQRRGTSDYSPAEIVDDHYFPALLGFESPTDTLRQSVLLPMTRDAQLGATHFMRLQWLLRDPPVHFVDHKAAFRVLAGAFRPTPHFLRTITSRLENLHSSKGGATREYWASIDSRLSELKTSQILGNWSERFATAVLSDLPGDDDSLRLLGGVLHNFSSDDPEWRTPIHIALSSSLADVTRAAFAIRTVLESWIPEDLMPDRFLTNVKRNPRRTWLRAIEYIDRAGALPEFMSAIRGDDSEELQKVSDAYLRWQSIRERAGDRS